MNLGYLKKRGRHSCKTAPGGAQDDDVVYYDTIHVAYKLNIKHLDDDFQVLKIAACSESDLNEIVEVWQRISNRLMFVSLADHNL